MILTMHSIKYIFFFILLCGFDKVFSQILEGNPANLPNQGICGTKVIVNGPENFEHLRNCSVINGELKIILFDRQYDDKDYEGISFPELREVRDFVLVYRMSGLKTLGQLFPNLALIRGQNLLVNYALVIYECKHIQEIGLKSLTKIMRGSVRFQNNPQLCFDRTIDWMKITGTNDSHVFLRNGPPTCPGKESCRGCDEQLCWNARNCQRLPSPQCHPECLDTCSLIEKKCHRCRHFINDNMCVKECPPDKYEYHGTHHCVTKALCRRLYGGFGWVWNRQCVGDCPKGYIPVNITKELGVTCELCSRLPCRKKCTGMEINGVGDAQTFKDCTHIDGSLQIRLKGELGPSVMKELEEFLGNIEEIRGHLKVYRSIGVTSLNFLKNLTVIKGEFLEYGSYALMVYENVNLQSLWDWNKKKELKITNGTVFFHFNPKLCLKEIDILKNLTNTKSTVYDVSPDTNGIRSKCNYTTLKAKSVVLDSRNVTISWEKYVPLHKSDREVTGYKLYYLEDPEDDITFYFGRDACSSRTWKSILVLDNPNTTSGWMSINITDLSHSTKYAYYVETYDGSEKSHIVDSSARSAQSDIKYFTTESELPSQPLEINAMTYTSDSLTVYWANDPDYRGNITRYIIELHIQHDDKNYLDGRNYCKNPLKLYPSATNKDAVQTQEDLDPEEPCECDQLQKVWDKYFKYEPTKYRVRNRHGQIVEKTLAELVGLFLEEEKNANRTKMKRNVGKFVIPKDFHQPLNRPTIDNKTQNDKYHYFSTEFLSHHQNFTITNLKHFTKYMIFMAACIGPLDSDCGAVAITVERTLKDIQADKILTLRADSVNDSAVVVRWGEPENVNGAILSYTVEYKLIDIENSQIDYECVTRLQHEQNSYKYTINNMAPGTYQIRVKATSLAGDGNYTDHVRVTVHEHVVQLHWAVITFMCLLSFATLAYISYHFQRTFICHFVNDQRLIPAEDLAVRYNADSEGEDVEIYGIR